MTTELRVAVSRLFPYEATLASGRIGEAQELISLITRMIDRARIHPDFQYRATESEVACLNLKRGTAIYLDGDIWLSWCDLLSQCIEESAGRGCKPHVLAANVSSCVDLDSPEIALQPVRWFRGGRDAMPTGLVDPALIETLRSRWKKASRPVVWEDSGHQPPLALKRLIARLVQDSEGVVIRYGSTYFNPKLSVTCGATACGSGGNSVSDLECSVSDGIATVRGILRTTAQTPLEQATALEFVRQRLRERCAEAGLDCAS